MSIGELCNRDVVVVERDASIADAASLMREYHVGDLVVVEQATTGRRPVGILTDRDIVVEVVAASLDHAAVSVGDIMSTDLLLAQEGDDLFDTLRRMRDRGVRRVPVVDPRGLLTGILVVDDLLDLLAEQLDTIVGLIGKEVRLERIRRRL
jgi:CBS domain-containing protein